MKKTDAEDPDAPQWDIEGPERDKLYKHLPPRGKVITPCPTKQNHDVEQEFPAWPDPALTTKTGIMEP